MKFIKLTQGKRAIVDNVVYPLISNVKWCAIYDDGWHVACSVRRNGKWTTMYLHQFVWRILQGSPIPIGSVIDHRNRNGLDCRGGNLRIATHSQSAMNRGMRSDNTSGVIGVSKHGGKWWSRITVNGIVLSLGLYYNKKEAAIVRRAAEKKYFGEFAI